MTLLARRSFLAGFGGLVAAPLVVRAESLMPLRGVSFQPRFHRYSLVYSIEADRMLLYHDIADMPLGNALCEVSREQASKLCTDPWFHEDSPQVTHLVKSVVLDKEHSE